MTKRWLNGPTVLTLIRIVLVVPLMISIFIDSSAAKVVAIICFAVASLTDFVDGKWARKSGQVTELGKFADPLADKMLVNLTFLALVVLGEVPVWAFGIILVRDFMVDGVRMMAAGKKVTIAASKLGKLKTLVQMVTLILIMVNMITQNATFVAFNNCLIIVVVRLTVISGANYLVKGWKLLK